MKPPFKAGTLCMIANAPPGPWCDRFCIVLKHIGQHTFLNGNTVDAHEVELSEPIEWAAGGTSQIAKVATKFLKPVSDPDIDLSEVACKTLAKCD